MCWVFTVIFIYLICTIINSWGGWCIISCFLGGTIILMIGNYFNYFLLSEWFGLDQIAFILVFLCFLVLGTRLVRSYKDLKKGGAGADERGRSIAEVVVLILLGRILFFSFSSFMDFYFFFEFSLVPTFWLILKWGYQPERLQAGLYIIIYTVSASLPLLIGLVMFWIVTGSDNILLAKCLRVKLIRKEYYWAWLFLSIGFLVKLPVYFFHGWLPKAHVEAPLRGSIILAGVLLKFGAYGVIRLTWITEISIVPIILFILCFSVWGGVVRSYVCAVQSDLKALIAYSSIGHIAVSLRGVLRIYSLGKFSGVCLFFAHGLSSPLLFSLAARAYDLVGRRNVVLRKGVLRVFPIFSIVWFGACVVNISFPPSLNFWGEVYSVTSTCWLDLVFILPIGLIVFLAGCYSLILYNWVNHGVSRKIVYPIWGLRCRYIYRGAFLIIILILGFLGLDFIFV